MEEESEENGAIHGLLLYLKPTVKRVMPAIG